MGFHYYCGNIPGGLPTTKIPREQTTVKEKNRRKHPGNEKKQPGVQRRGVFGGRVEMKNPILNNNKFSNYYLDFTRGCTR